MEDEKHLFFEGIDGEKFRELIKRSSSAEEFAKLYDLKEGVDTSSRAKLGVIKIKETDWFTNRLKFPLTKEVKGDLDLLIEQVEQGYPISPIIVETPTNVFPEIGSQNTSESELNYKLIEGKEILFACFMAGLEFVPAVVYYQRSSNQQLHFDNTLSLADFLDIDFAKVFESSHGNTKTESSDDTFQALVGNGYFNNHPIDILGEEYDTKDAFGKDVKRVKGSLDDALDKIEIKASNSSLTDSEEEVLDSIEHEEISEIINTDAGLANVTKVLQLREDGNVADLSDLQSFDETLRTYNEGISDDEIRAWIWYQRKAGFYINEQHILQKKNGWSNFVIPIYQEEEYLDQWLKQGILCYTNGSFIPSVLYNSGNIYNRISSLLADSATIKEKYGQEQYDRQWEGLQKVVPVRLSLTDPIAENRLTIKVISDLAKEIKVSELADGTTFKETNLHTRVQGAVNKSLVDAFLVWLGDLSKDKFKKSTSFEIQKYYINNKAVTSQNDKEEKVRRKENAKIEGELFFAQFLAEGLLEEDQRKIEHIWNSRFNGYMPVDYFKVPIAFQCSKTFKNKPLFIRPAQREGLGFLAINGSGCIAYDVGVGKTMTGILSIAQAIESGMCKRPLIVVPNQTYKNWLAEIQGIFSQKGDLELSGVLPQYQVNDLYNLGEKYLKKLQDKYGNVKAVDEGSISVITYEGLRRIGFNEETWGEMGLDLYHILNQGNDGSGREKSALFQKVEDLMGISLAGSLVNIEDLGFDFMLKDEAHNMKKIFTAVKGRMKSESEKRYTKRYKITSGQPSSLGLKAFMLSQYILRKNNNRNVVLLTATPFTNNPLEIYSMLALMGFFRQVDRQISNLQGFFNHFIKSSMQLTINAKMKPERKEVVLGFNNLIALQQVIFRFIDYKSGEDANIQRPQKWVLPLTHKLIGDEVIPLSKEEQISTNLQPTAEQKSLLAELEQYIIGKTSFADFCLNPTGIEESNLNEEAGEAIKESDLSGEDLEGTRVLRGISLARQIAFSPYLFSCHRYNKKDIDYKKFINSSPKLQYVMGCIKTVQEFHKAKGEKMSGQVIYSNAGVSFFPLIAEYLHKELGFSSSEIGTISGGMTARKKELVKEKFQNGKIKILLGSNSIKEGINLQNRATVLYDLWLDWNPTDLKQLEGRIWRYGNQFANVRVVLPLMEDSIDTAIFQKLEEKTSRINEIWYRSGQANSLKLEDFNPAELKMGLITNTKVLAEITLMEEREHLRDEISHLINQKKELEEISNARHDFYGNIELIEDKVNQLKPQKKDAEKRSTEAVLRIYRGLLDDPEGGLSYIDNENFVKVRKAYNLLKNALERILEPRGMNMDFVVEEVVGSIDLEIEELLEKMEKRTGEEAVQKLSKELLKERIRKGYKPKSVAQRVEEFASLNDELLSERLYYDKAEMIDLIEEESSPKLIEMQKILEESEQIEQLILEMEKLKGKAA